MLKFIHKTALPLIVFMAMALQTQAVNIYVDWQATGTNNGSSWTNAYTSLATAIANANAGDGIYVAQGTYANNGSHFTLKEGVRLFGGCPPPGAVLDFFRILFRNPTNYPTILTGNNVIRINNSLSDATSINGFRIQASNTGVQIGFLTNPIDVQLTIGDCIFSGGNNGVQIAFPSFFGPSTISPKFVKCEFTNLTGGLNMITGGLNNDTDQFHPQFNRCKFHNVTNSVQMEHVRGSMRPHFEHCSFYNNNGHVIRNVGFGIYTNQPIQCYCPPSYNYNPTFVNSEFYNNNGVVDALLGIANQNGDLSVDFTSCTIWNNNTPQGSSKRAFNVSIRDCLLNIFRTETALKFQNSILWDNGETAGSAWMQLARGMQVTMDHSLIQANSCAGGDPAFILGPAAAINCGNGMKYNLNPQFVSASVTNPNLRLSAFSPARNTGSRGIHAPIPNDVDLAGIARVLESKIDMGAYEYCPSQGGCIVAARSLRQTKQQVLDNHIQITTYPNPVKGTITVKTGHQIEIKALQLMTIEGKVVKGNTRHHQLDVQDVPKGLYLLKVQTDFGTKILRVVKE
ncbi:hypothetical protein BKI52_23880 [marine bacterium AO1-C]|nr:hypothetical protein BKI52_23880 [marine bacterium AO1-C]